MTHDKDAAEREYQEWIADKFAPGTLADKIANDAWHASRASLTASEAKTAVPEDEIIALLERASALCDFPQQSECFHAMVNRLRSPNPSARLVKAAPPKNQPPHKECKSPGECGIEGICFDNCKPAAAPSSPALDAAKVREQALSEATQFIADTPVIAGRDWHAGTALALQNELIKGVRALAASPSEAQQPAQDDDPHPPHRCCECLDCREYWAPIFAEEGGIAGGQQPAQQEGWVSIQDRLPEATGEYLLFRPTAHHKPANDPNVCIGVYFANIRQFDGRHDVTHWMPIPAPPSHAGIDKGDAK